MRLNNRSTASTSRNKLLYVSGQRHDSDSTCSKRVKREKIDRHRARLGENDDLPHLRAKL